MTIKKSTTICYSSGGMSIQFTESGLVSIANNISAVTLTEPEVSVLLNALYSEGYLEEYLEDNR